MSERLAAALHQKRQAERAIADALKSDYPVGTPVRYTHGGDVYQAIIAEHGYGDRIYVLSPRSGRKFWLHAYRLLGRAEKVEPSRGKPLGRTSTHSSAGVQVPRPAPHLGTAP